MELRDCYGPVFMKNPRHFHALAHFEATFVCYEFYPRSSLIAYETARKQFFYPQFNKIVDVVSIVTFRVVQTFSNIQFSLQEGLAEKNAQPYRQQ